MDAKLAEMAYACTLIKAWKEEIQRKVQKRSHPSAVFVVECGARNVCWCERPKQPMRAEILYLLFGSIAGKVQSPSLQSLPPAKAIEVVCLLACFFVLFNPLILANKRHQQM